MEQYKNLSAADIKQLENSGCRCADWSGVRVADGFSAATVRNCRFSGRVFIGAGVEIDGVHDEICNYIISDGVVIRNVETIKTDGFSSFGNGTTVNVLNEASGREVVITERLTAQTAYLEAMYRHRPKLTAALRAISEKYVVSVSSDMGRIGAGATVKNCGLIRNVNIGASAVVDGAAELSDGTVVSYPDSPAVVGRGVIARRFIILDSAHVADFAQLSHCFVGQGCCIGVGFSAEHSLFFANSVCMNGEACAVFAGPYTVTHHKSTLLIGGMYSFYNAGSGTNFSNHMYRTGPVHQGIMERGAKTSSSSYVLFPARVGAFSVVKGRHYSNFDTSDFPFSYIVESEGHSLLLPAANIATYGTRRDIEKWGTRDNRHLCRCLDIINTEGFTPYTVEKICRALSILRSLSDDELVEIDGCNVFVSRRAVLRAIDLYELAVECYVGGVASETEFSEGVRYDDWVDAGGLVAPRAEVDLLCSDIERETLKSIDEITKRFFSIHRVFKESERRYVEKFAVKDILRRYSELSCRWEKLVEEDKNKDFSERMRIGYGIDNKAVADSDFVAVHGK